MTRPVPTDSAAPLNVVICAHDAPHYINGPNIWLQRMLPELRQRGVTCHVLFFPSGDPSACPTIGVLRSQGFNCEVYQGKNFSEFQVPWILKRVQAKATDVFVSNLRIPAYHAARWIKDSGIPTVGVIHSDDSFYRSVIEEFVRKPDPSPLSATVCVSEHLSELVEQCGPGKVVNRTIPCGVPIPGRMSQPGSPLRIIYAGRFVEVQKRISDVTRALCLATREIPGTEAVLYGSGPAEADIARIIVEQGAGKAVRIGGLIGKDEIEERFLEAHVFALLSDYEGLPIALLEAMAGGLVPVCSYMRSGIPELVEHEVTGLLVNDREQAFVDAIRRLKTEEGLWTRLSNAARARVDTGYSIGETVARWRRLFDDLTQGAPAVRRSIRIPRRIELPPRHPEIDESQDRRWPGYRRYFASRLRQYVIRLSRVTAPASK